MEFQGNMGSSNSNSDRFSNLVVIPYIRGYFARGFLGGLWQEIEEAKDWERIFWETPVEETKPIRIKGDLSHWVHLVTDPYNPCELLLGYDKFSQEIVGVIWFNCIKGKTAHASLWMKPKYRGSYSRQFVKRGLDYAFNELDFEVLFAATPHMIARNLIVKCGFKEQAKVKGIYYLTMEKEHYYGQRQSKPTKQSHRQTAGQEA